MAEAPACMDFGHLFCKASNGCEFPLWNKDINAAAGDEQDFNHESFVLHDDLTRCKFSRLKGVEQASHEDLVSRVVPGEVSIARLECKNLI